MRVLLVLGPDWDPRTPPYNLALLKAVCEKHGHATECLDLNIRFFNSLGQKEQARLYSRPTEWYREEFAADALNRHEQYVQESERRILASTAKVIGFTVTGLNQLFARKLAGRIKRQDPERVIIFGGPHCFRTEAGERLLEMCPELDAVCLHEGEHSLPEFLSALESKASGPLPGVSRRDGNGKIVSASEPTVAVDLDDLPFADFSDFQLEDYTAPELAISSSRGCVNRCRFCSEAAVWQRYRRRSAEALFGEVRYQLERYPTVTQLYFCDSLINGDLENLGRFADLIIDSGLRFKWGGQAMIRPEMDDNFFRRLRQAGLSHVSFGLESASQKLLKEIGKGFTPECAEQVIRASREAGIRTDVNIVIGLPGETEEDSAATLEFLRRNRRIMDAVFLHPLVISAGSFYHSHQAELGIKFSRPDDPNSWFQGENTLEGRLKTLALYQKCLGANGRSFLAREDYLVLLAETETEKKDPARARKFYAQAAQACRNPFKKMRIRRKIKEVGRQKTEVRSQKTE